MTFGIVTTNGYLNAEFEDDVDSSDVLKLIQDGLPIFGTFGLPGAPSHAAADVVIAPGQLVAIIEKPAR